MQNTNYKTKIKKGDKIIVLVGRDKGREGTVGRVLPKDHTVLIAGVNQYKKHVKPQGKDRPGEIVTLDRPLAIAKVALVCPKCKQPTRVGYSRVNDTWMRKCRKCDNLIDDTKSTKVTKEVKSIKPEKTKVKKVQK